ncbi:fatty acid desaturase family protein [Variovorax atrisoli]|uniref:fatty acid desaturase family protein n=1 Tax=Variovorax atrisoli TaxID=3394203 RepID=UPI00160ADEC5|nr:fatty acid desaturase family protein [Variovorax sp. BK613]MBB3641796.1 fatty acid desaturase [Variovorax sp. BK613]
MTAAPGMNTTIGGKPLRLPFGPGTLQELATLRPWRCALQILTQWLVCALAIVAAQRIGQWPATIAAMLVIATRQHAMLVLMHEAAHRLLARDRLVNDIVGNLLLAFPLTLSVARYRAHHFRHHRHLNDEGDPDLADSEIPATRGRFLALLLRDASGLTTLATLRSANSFGMLGLFSRQSPGTGLDRCLAVAFIAVVAALVAWFGVWREFVLYWLAPVLLFMPAILRVRGIAEHGGRLNHPAHTAARSLRVGWIERFLWAPCHINRHWEHHSCPAVPSYNLPRLSRLLAAGDARCAAANPTRGYFIGPHSLIHELYPAAGEVPARAAAEKGAHGPHGK